MKSTRTPRTGFNLNVGHRWAQNVQALHSSHPVDALDALDHIDVVLNGANVTLFCEQEPVLAWVLELAKQVAKVNRVLHGHVEVEFEYAPYILSIQREGERAHASVIRLLPTPAIHASARDLKWGAVSLEVKVLSQTLAQHLDPSIHSDTLRELVSVAPISGAHQHQDPPQPLNPTLQGAGWEARLSLPVQRDLDGYTALFAVQGELTLQGHANHTTSPLLALFDACAPDSVHTEAWLASLPSSAQQHWMDMSRAVVDCVVNHLPELANHHIVQRILHVLDGHESSSMQALQSASAHEDGAHKEEVAQSSKSVATGLPWSFTQTRALYPHIAWSWSSPRIDFHTIHVEDDAMFCSTSQGLWMLDPKTSNTRWHAPHAANRQSLLNHEVCWLESSTQTQAVSRGDGSVLGTLSHEKPGTLHAIALQRHALRLEEGGLLTCLAAHQGQITTQWTRSFRPMSTLTTFNSVIYIVQDSRIHMVESSSGQSYDALDPQGVVLHMTPLFGAMHAFVRRRGAIHLLRCSPTHPPEEVTCFPDAIDVLDVYLDHACVHVLSRTLDHRGLAWDTLTRATHTPRWRIKRNVGLTGRMSWHAEHMLIHSSEGEIWCLEHADAAVRWCIQDEELSTQTQPLAAHSVRDGCCLAGQVVEVRSIHDGALIHAVTQTVDAPSFLWTASPFGLIIGERGGASSGDDVVYRLDFSHYLAIVQ